MGTSLTGVRGVVFDLDDTLYPESDYVLSGFDAVGAWLAQRMACPSDPALRLRELFADGVRRDTFDRLLGEWNCSEAATLIPDMVSCYRRHMPNLTLLPDAQRAMKRWRKHARLGLITDGPLESQTRKVRSLRLEDWLDPIVCTDTWGSEFWKPHPRAFETIERQWGLFSHELVYIADNPSKDFVAPNARGWQTIQLCRPGCEYGQVPAAAGGEAAHRVGSLDEVDLTF